MRLEELLQHPERAKTVSRDELPDLLAELRRIEVTLQLRLNSPNGHHPAPSARPTENWLTPDEVAARLKVERRWVYRHAKNWRFVKRNSRKNLRISESGLTKWMVNK